MIRRVLILLLLASLFLADRVAGQDSTAVALLGVSAWDIEFHAITKGGDYIQHLMNPYNVEHEAIGVFDDGMFAAYYFRLEGRYCYIGTRANYRGFAYPMISPSPCRMFDFFYEQVWLIRNGIETKPLELHRLPKKASGTDY